MRSSVLRALPLFALLVLTGCEECAPSPETQEEAPEEPVSQRAGEVPACGVERWKIKTLTDADADRVDLLHPRQTKVEDLVSLAPPRWYGRLPRLPEERKVYTVTARLVGAKLEEDSDYHIVIEGDSGVTMIVEIPSEECAIGSRVRKDIDLVREHFEQEMGSRLSKGKRRFKTLKKPVMVRITGVGFFDKIHGQRGVAPNGFELHPVLKFDLLE